MTFDKIVDATEALNAALREEGNLHGVALRLNLETMRLETVEMIALAAERAEDRLDVNELTTELEIWSGDDIVPGELRNLLVQAVEMLNEISTDPRTLQEQMDAAPFGASVTDDSRVYIKQRNGLWELRYSNGEMSSSQYASDRFPGSFRLNG